MNIRSSTAALLLLISTVPAFGEQITTTSTPEQESYVDPQSNRDRICPNSPFRPGWVMVQPHGFGWKSDLWQAVYELRSAETVIRMGECSCDLVFPSWENMRPELEQIASEWPNVAGPDMTEEQGININRYLGNLYREKSSMTRQFRSICKTVLSGE